MSRIMVCSWLVVALAALLVAGCAKPKYLLKELRLPPGAVEVEFQEYDLEGMNSVSSTFNFDGGWEGVVAHFDRILKRAGYTESTPGGSMLGMPANTPELHSKDAMRYYSKPDSDYSVQLTNHPVLIKESSTDLPELDIDTQGEFGLVVMKFSLSQ